MKLERVTYDEVCVYRKKIRQLIKVIYRAKNQEPPKLKLTILDGIVILNNMNNADIIKVLNDMDIAFGNKFYYNRDILDMDDEQLELFVRLRGM